MSIQPDNSDQSSQEILAEIMRRSLSKDSALQAKQARLIEILKNSDVSNPESEESDSAR